MLSASGEEARLTHEHSSLYLGPRRSPLPSRERAAYCVDCLRYHKDHTLPTSSQTDEARTFTTPDRLRGRVGRCQGWPPQRFLLFGDRA